MRNIDEAEERCVEQGSQLVSIHDAAENSAVFTLAREATFPVWLGLKRVNQHVEIVNDISKVLY